MIKPISIILGATFIGLASYFIVRKDKQTKQIEREISEERREFVRMKFVEYLEKKKG